MKKQLILFAMLCAVAPAWGQGRMRASQAPAESRRSAGSSMFSRMQTPQSRPQAVQPSARVDRAPMPRPSRGNISPAFSGGNQRPAASLPSRVPQAGVSTPPRVTPPVQTVSSGRPERAPGGKPSRGNTSFTPPRVDSNRPATTFKPREPQVTGGAPGGKRPAHPPSSPGIHGGGKPWGNATGQHRPPTFHPSPRPPSKPGYHPPMRPHRPPPPPKPRHSWSIGFGYSRGYNSWYGSSWWGPGWYGPSWYSRPVYSVNVYSPLTTYEPIVIDQPVYIQEERVADPVFTGDPLIETEQVWVEGYWQLEKDDEGTIVGRTWIPGHWEERPVSLLDTPREEIERIWVEGYWSFRKDEEGFITGRVWVPGHWENHTVTPDSGE